MNNKDINKIINLLYSFSNNILSYRYFFIIYSTLISTFLLLNILLLINYLIIHNEFNEKIKNTIKYNYYGSSFYRIIIDPLNKTKYNWQPLFIDSIKHSLTPFPSKEVYKIKILSIINLEKNKKLYFHLKANDGITIYINQKKIFDEWSPTYMGINTTFIKKLNQGYNILEIDYYLGYNNGILELKILDSLDKNVIILPLDLKLNSYFWQSLCKRQYWSYKILFIGFILNISIFFIFPILIFIHNIPFYHKLLLKYWQLINPNLSFTNFMLILLLQISLHINITITKNLFQLIILPISESFLIIIILKIITSKINNLPINKKILQFINSLNELWKKYDKITTPLLIFSIFFIYIYSIIHYHGGIFPDTWLNAPWDAQQYKDIMTKGYKLFRTETGIVGGNYPWHPFYPYFARIFYKTGLNRDWALLITSWVSSAIAFITIYRLASNLFNTTTARWTLIALICYPASFYLLIGYPYGTAIALGSSYILVLKINPKRLWLTFILGFCLGMTYPTAFLISLSAIYEKINKIKKDKITISNIKHNLLPILSPILGLITLCLHHNIYFKNFLLPITAHSNWKIRAEWPWNTLLNVILQSPIQSPENITIFLLIINIIIFSHHFYPTLWIYLVIILLIGPSTGTLESNYRQYLIAWPLFLLIGNSSKKNLIKISLLCLMIYISIWYFIPLWLMNDLV